MQFENMFSRFHSFKTQFYLFCALLLQVLVDGPVTNVPRQAYRLNNLQLTKFRLKFPYHAPTRDVRKAWTKADLKTQWENSAWAQKAKDVKKVCIVLTSAFGFLHRSHSEYSYQIEVMSLSWWSSKTFIGIAVWYPNEARLHVWETIRTSVRLFKIIYTKMYKCNLINISLCSLHSVHHWVILNASSCVMPKNNVTSCCLPHITHWRSALRPMEHPR